MRPVLLAAAVACALAAAAPASAQTPAPAPAPALVPGVVASAPHPAVPPSPILARVRQAGVLRCGSAIRPGLAFPALDHSWHGLNVDMCRAIAAAAIGPDAPIEFHGYALHPDFERIRAGADDVAFLTTTELFGNELFADVLAGPTVVRESTNVMVWDSSPVRDVSGLGTTMICAEPGTPAERNLRAYAAGHGWRVNFSEWMEVEEMMDAFAVGRCPAVAMEGTALAALGLQAEADGHKPRVLPEPLAVTPVMAVSPVSDPAWANVVTWSVNTVLHGGAVPGLPDVQTLPVPGAALGLHGDWQARVLAAAGDAEAMRRRSLGEDSPLGLPAGPNASWREGGLMVAPAVE